MHSLAVSFIRLIIAALPLAWIFTKFSSAENLIWFAFPAAELIAFAAALVFMKQISAVRLKTAEA